MISTVAGLVHDLNDRNIEYCHWKSNEKLQQTLDGETDFDVLCHRGDRNVVRKVLNEHGFIKLDDVAFTGYPGIENYVGYDSKTGQYIHAHLHFELTFGTPFLKEYVTPWAPDVLSRRIIDPKSNVPLTDPTTELFLLIVRYSMKVRRYNPIARRSYFTEFVKEYDWLSERADETELDDIACDLLNPTAAERVGDVVDGKPTIRDLIRVGNPVRSELNQYSTYPSWSTTLVALARKGFRGMGKINREVLNRPYSFRRKIPSRGIEVAIVGIDGSGKSTHLAELRNWLSWKMDVHTVYFGSGDGPSSLLRYPFKKLNELRSPSHQSDSQHQQTGSCDSRTGQGYTNDEETTSYTGNSVGIMKAIWAIVLAREKRKKQRRATRARNRGMIVLMDRYPQNQFENINDGPLLGPWTDADSGLLRRIGEWEEKIYADLHEYSPDLIIKLTTDPRTAKKRKPETPISNLNRKADVINSLEYENSRLVTVDTHRDIEYVLEELKREVWKEI